MGTRQKGVSCKACKGYYLLSKVILIEVLLNKNNNGALLSLERARVFRKTRVHNLLSSMEY